MPVDSPFARLLSEVAVESATVHARGSRTRYWTYGPADATTTLVFVHGYRGEHHGLEPVIAQLRDVRIVAPDLPGFGESSELGNDRHDIAGYAAWLGEFVAATGLQDAVVLGHSFGSIVVAHAVADGLVAPPKVILVNPIASPAASGPSKVLTSIAIFGYRLSAKLPDALGRWLVGNRAVVRGMSTVMVTTKDRALRRWIHDQHDTYFSAFSSSATVVEGFEASVSRTVAEVAGRVTPPTLLIGAELDPITPVAAVQALEKAIPDATLRVIPAVGHLVHYEKSREAAGFIVEFLGVGRLAP